MKNPNQFIAAVPYKNKKTGEAKIWKFKFAGFTEEEGVVTFIIETREGTTFRYFPKEEICLETLRLLKEIPSEFYGKKW